MVIILGALGDSFLLWVGGGTILNASVTHPLLCVVLTFTHPKIEGWTEQPLEVGSKDWYYKGL